MALEIKGKLIKKLQVQTGEGKNGTWKKSSFVIETGGDYPKKVCFIAWNGKSDSIEKVKIKINKLK